MNILKREKQELAIKCLIDGNSIRSTERITGVHRDTIMRLMVRTGENCMLRSLGSPTPGINRDTRNLVVLCSNPSLSESGVQDWISSSIASR